MIELPEHLDADSTIACVLGLGPLTPTGRLAAQTIHQVFGDRIVTLCNTPFRESLDDNSRARLGRLIDLGSSSSYASGDSWSWRDSDRHHEFGSLEFSRLTVFKWSLLRQTMLDHPERRVVLFTDLDVAWLQPPDAECSLLATLDATALIQDASTDAGVRHYCTGIMIWRNCPRAIALLDQLEQRQLDMLRAGRNLNDESIFNMVVRESADSHGVLPLDPFRYVVGRRLRHLAAARTSGLEWRPVAVHANFIPKDRDKAAVLRHVIGSQRSALSMPFLMMMLFVRGRITRLRLLFGPRR